MSAPVNDTTPPKQLLEQEDLPTGSIAWVGIGSLALFAAGIYVSYLILANDTLRLQAKGASTVPPALIEQHSPEMGIVDQLPFAIEHRDSDERKGVNAHLSGYGWTDKDKKVIHVPIEEAMKQVVAEQGKGK